jgi:2-oxoglutarate ferredoxin oxidoreductase subunit alpha
LVDKHLTESSQTLNLEEVEKEFTFDYNQRINMIESVNEGQLNPDGIYKRYEKDNINRTIPGTINGIYTCTGDEHDAVGQITEDPNIRTEMMQRRMGKLELIKKELSAPKLIGSEDADFTIVSWGSNYGAIVEAMEKLDLNNVDNPKVNFLCLEYLFPFHNEEIKELLANTKKIILLECNYTGQLGELITEKTGIIIDDKILRYDGKTFTTNEVYEELTKRINKGINEG